MSRYLDTSTEKIHQTYGATLSQITQALGAQKMKYLNPKSPKVSKSFS